MSKIIEDVCPFKSGNVPPSLPVIVSIFIEPVNIIFCWVKEILVDPVAILDIDDDILACL